VSRVLLPAQLISATSLQAITCTSTDNSVH